MATHGQISVLGFGKGNVPVKVYVESTTEIVGDGIDHNIEYDRGKNPVSTDQRKMWLSLSAQAHLSLDFLAADLLAKRRVLCEDTEGEETKLCVMRHSRRAICMVEQVGRQREEARERRFLIALLRAYIDQMIPKEFVGVGKVVSR